MALAFRTKLTLSYSLVLAMLFAAAAVDRNFAGNRRAQAGRYAWVLGGPLAKAWWPI